MSKFVKMPKATLHPALRGIFRTFHNCKRTVTHYARQDSDSMRNLLKRSIAHRYPHSTESGKRYHKP